MSETIENNISIPENTEIVKKKRRPPGIHTPWSVVKEKTSARWLPDGTYNQRPLDPDYFRKYFKEHYHKQYTCIYCNKTLKCCDNIKRHEKSRNCLKIRNASESLESESLAIESLESESLESESSESESLA
jgi:hypothetical protein